MHIIYWGMYYIIPQLSLRKRLVNWQRDREVVWSWWRHVPHHLATATSFSMERMYVKPSLNRPCVNPYHFSGAVSFFKFSHFNFIFNVVPLDRSMPTELVALVATASSSCLLKIVLTLQEESMGWLLCTRTGWVSRDRMSDTSFFNLKQYYEICSYVRPQYTFY